MSRNGTTSTLWYWPDGLYMLIPTLLTWALWSILFFEHLFNLASKHDVSLRFQALFCRIILVFPLDATLAYLGAAYPWSTAWIEFVVSVTEAYVITAFFALLTGLSYLFFSPAEFRKQMMQNKWTKKPFVRCGPSFKDGDQAFDVFLVSIVQILVVKPLTSLIRAIIFEVAPNASNAAYVPFKIIGILSLIIAIVALLRLYRGIEAAEESPLKGHNVLSKFIAVKLLFAFLVLNSVLIVPLIDAQVIPVDPWICPLDAYDESDGTQNCRWRLLWVIFIFETVCICIPACFSYRHHNLHKLEKDRKGNIPHFLHSLFNLIDLKYFIDGSLVNKDEDSKPSMEERKGLLEEINME